MISIIGAGPVGCYAAALLADDFEVKVFEEHSQVGLPVQCTGIVTPDIFKFVPKNNDFIINRISDVRIFSPDNKHIKLKFKNPDLILDRAKFDNYFYDLARKKGVEFYFQHRFVSANKRYALVKDLKSGKTRKFKHDFLVGADGARSAVAKNYNFNNKKKFFIGIQAVVKMKNINTVDYFPFKHGFGWAVPVDKNTLRVGVASKKNPRAIFENLLKKYKGKIVSKQGGLIPVFSPFAQIRKDNVFLIGDAAGFVKATTGGGLVPGLKSARVLAHTIINNFMYESSIGVKIYPSPWMHLEMSKLMDSFSRQDWNNLIEELNNEDSKKSLQKINRDRLFKLLLSLGFRNPRLIGFGLKHFDALF